MYPLLRGIFSPLQKQAVLPLFPLFSQQRPKRTIRASISALLILSGITCGGTRLAQSQDSPNARLVKAVQADDLKSAVETLDQGAAPNATIDGNPVSCTAAYHGQTALLKALLDHGARLDARKFDDHLTLLMFAALSGNPDTVQLLLDRKVNVNQKDELGETALMTVREPPAPTVTPATPDSSKQQETARSSGRTAILKMLLRAGADKEIRDIGGYTALMRYAKYGVQNGVEVLADAGAKVNAHGRDGNTALILAAGWQFIDKNLPTDGYPAIVQRLLKAGADTRIKNRAGQTALTAAGSAGHKDIVALLMPASPSESSSTRGKE